MNDSSPDDIACDVVDVSAGDQDAASLFYYPCIL